MKCNPDNRRNQYESKNDGIHLEVSSRLSIRDNIDGESKRINTATLQKNCGNNETICRRADLGNVQKHHHTTTS